MSRPFSIYDSVKAPITNTTQQVTIIFDDESGDEDGNDFSLSDDLKSNASLDLPFVPPWKKNVTASTVKNSNSTDTLRLSSLSANTPVVRKILVNQQKANNENIEDAKFKRENVEKVRAERINRSLSCVDITNSQNAAALEKQSHILVNDNAVHVTAGASDGLGYMKGDVSLPDGSGLGKAYTTDSTWQRRTDAPDGTGPVKAGVCDRMGQTKQSTLQPFSLKSNITDSLSKDVHTCNAPSLVTSEINTTRKRSVASQTDNVPGRSSPETQPAKNVAEERTLSHNSFSTVSVNNKKYVVLRQLGIGGSSKVEKVYDFEKGECFALKTVNLNNLPAITADNVKKEIDMLKKLQFSERVIKLTDYEYNVHENVIYTLMECGESDLATYLKKKLAEGTLHRYQRCVFWQDMLKAVQVLHNQGIVHSDIKPANFMLVCGEIKLIDFGISKQLDADATSMITGSVEGTINYMAPESLNGYFSDDAVNRAGKKKDIWSLGCILYYMVYGHTPFQHFSSNFSKMAAIVNPVHVIEFADVGEPHLIHTLKLCLERDPKKRASVDELLLHPYVT